MSYERTISKDFSSDGNSAAQQQVSGRGTIYFKMKSSVVFSQYPTSLIPLLFKQTWLLHYGFITSKVVSHINQLHCKLFEYFNNILRLIKLRLNMLLWLSEKNIMEVCFVIPERGARWRGAFPRHRLVVLSLGLLNVVLLIVVVVLGTLCKYEKSQNKQWLLLSLVHVVFNRTN